MNIRHKSIGLFVLFLCLILACEEVKDQTSSPQADANKVFSSGVEQLNLPMIIRENILAERGLNNIDSLDLFHLQFLQFQSYQKDHGYYLFGQFPDIEGSQCILLLEDSPEFSKAWLINYHDGHLLDKKLVYQQNAMDRKPRLYSYLKKDTLELNQDGSKRYYRWEEGRFVGL